MYDRYTIDIFDPPYSWHVFRKAKGLKFRLIPGIVYVSNNQVQEHLDFSLRNPYIHKKYFVPIKQSNAFSILRRAQNSGQASNISRTMAESSEHSHSYISKRTVVVSNFPADVGVEELTIHFQKEKNGGGDVEDVLVEGNVAFVIFDLPEGLECFVMKYLDRFKCLFGN